MTPMGYSNKVFFYYCAGHSTTYDLRMRVLLEALPDREALQRAVQKTMALFPEFAVRPVIGQDGKLYCEENHAEVVLFDESDPPRALGSDETNGHLLCLICGERSFIPSFFHGLSDYTGYWSFLRTLVRHYAWEKSGISASAAKAVRLDMDEQERRDPYARFGNVGSVSTWIYEDRGAAMIDERMYPDETDYLKNYEIDLNAKAFTRKKRELSTSFIPLLVAAVSQAVDGLYERNGLPIVVKVPANLRPLYGTNTTANFSDSLVLKLDDDMLKQSVKAQCKELQDSMDKQLCRENFDQILAGKVKKIRDLENGKQTIEQFNRRMTNASSASSARQITFALSCLGRLHVPDECAPFVRGFVIEPYVPTNGFFLFVDIFGKNLRIRICQRFDSGRLARKIAEVFESYGLSAAIRDAGTVTGNKVYVERLKHIGLQCSMESK